MIEKIISGGQTGADQAALDVAIKLEIPHGGWIPKGRITEAGILPEKYKLKEMPTDSYPKRTEKNVLDSDGTLILSHGKLTGGSVLTQNLANQHGRPCLQKSFLASMVLNKKVVIKDYGTDRYGRILGVDYLGDTDINLQTEIQQLPL